ncbi:hypothetical protein BD769DRAFT_1659899 [Suillus cothurnatus]|nr:hypothetical protein BD769DRAFT_1659899 [Suillus cothurnatus]
MLRPSALSSPGPSILGSPLIRSPLLISDSALDSLVSSRIVTASNIFQTLWDELLDHGDEPFELSFPPICGVSPSLMLKATVVHTCDNHDSALFDSLIDCKIAQDIDVGHAQYAKYMTSNTVSHLNDGSQHFQSVLDCCPVNHPDHAAALTNLTWARLQGYIQNNLQDIDTVKVVLK